MPMDRLKAIARYVLSYRKSVWSITDYPIRFTEQKADGSESEERRKRFRWSAQIVNWWQLSGHGETREEALRNLDAAFKLFKVAGPLLHSNSEPTVGPWGKS